VTVIKRCILLIQFITVPGINNLITNILLEALQLQRSFGLLNEFLPFGPVSDVFLPVCFISIFLMSLFTSSSHLFLGLPDCEYYRIKIEVTVRILKRPNHNYPSCYLVGSYLTFPVTTTRYIPWVEFVFSRL